MKKKLFTTLLIVLIFTKLSNSQERKKPEFLQQNQQQATKIVADMTLDQKIGQLFIASAVSDVDRNTAFIEKKGYRLDPEYIHYLIENYNIGGVIFLGMGEPTSQVKLTQQFQDASKYPLLMCQDLEWGLSMRLDDAARFPRNMTLGALQDDTLIYQLGLEIGRQCKEIGIHVNFAPVVDVNNNAKNPVINDRSFGENKEKVSAKAKMLYKGLHDAGVLSCIKHFPGHGDTDTDSHYALPRILHDNQRLHDIELYPFKQLIDAGVPAVMIAHLAIPALEQNPDVPTTLSHAVVTKLLQQELCFEGLIVTDALDMKALSGSPGKVALQAFLAGNDLLICSSDVPAAITEIKRAVLQQTISEQELDRRVLKIVLAKQWAQKHSPEKLTTLDLYQRLHTPEAAALKQQLYAQSITNVKNADPLTTHEHIAYLQIGGQEKTITVNQLGQDINKTIPAQSHCKKVIDQELECPTFTFSNNPNQDEIEHLLKQLSSTETVIISIFDMNKFATQQFGLSDNTLRCIDALKKANKKVIVCLFGSPYSLKFFDAADGIIMAYEDDKDAQQAAAEIIVGKRKALGKLPVTS